MMQIQNMMNMKICLLVFLIGVVLVHSVNIYPGGYSTTYCYDANRGITFDFQSGSLFGWTVSGNAFRYQPTLGDNPTARKRGMPSRHEGNYWIGGYENYTAIGQTPGSVVGDGLTGTLTSRPFRIFSNFITFLIAGGNLPGIRLELVEYPSGTVLRSSTGYNSQTLIRRVWDVRSLFLKYAFIRAVDSQTKAWGHLNFDDIKFVK